MFKNIMQLAWVTTDVRQAVKQFQEGQGIENIAIFDGFTLSTAEGGEVVIDVALAYVGDMQFEIIQPVSGEVDLYRRHLPADPTEYALRFHHICSRLDSIEEYEQVLSDYRKRGVTVEVDGSFGEGGRFFYADTRGLVDHYQEYVYRDDATKEFLNTLPRN
ncbi:VOC family protein [Rhodococcus chondri]|uniref:VOC family protein n=1 Tax=Rhodococcus chondri TaxID=3065941 RepID=A0ABU7JY40_9NOCA|nr:VOC family protein [Rhodococcus sp. CC-R104]MEE2034933.1 VOC family protein [Rhodococcus sp. CC-R104]